MRSSRKCSLQLQPTFVRGFPPTTETSISWRVLRVLRLLRMLGIMIDRSLLRFITIWWWWKIVRRFDGKTGGAVTRIRWLLWMTLSLIRVVDVAVFLFALSIKGCGSGCSITNTSTCTPTSLERMNVWVKNVVTRWKKLTSCNVQRA